MWFCAVFLKWKAMFPWGKEVLCFENMKCFLHNATGEFLTSILRTHSEVFMLKKHNIELGAEKGRERRYSQVKMYLVSVNSHSFLKPPGFQLSLVLLKIHLQNIT